MARSVPGGRGQVVDRHRIGTQDGCLERRGHVAARPVLGAADRPPLAVEHDDEAGQVFVFAAESIGDPRAQAGMARRARARNSS